MGNFGNNNTEEIKLRLDIGEVVGRYVQLKRMGAGLRGLCPFHGEKTPGFYVTPSRQIWHCFGCGEGGDAISFVQKIEHIEFRQALEMLAEIAGVELSAFDPREQKLKEEKELLYKINAFAAEFYHRSLQGASGQEARKYLSGRGLDQSAIARWQIGFCQPMGSDLLSALAKHGITVQNLAKVGIYAQNDRGVFYDRFRGRITFPIKNLRGQVVGFSARIFNGRNDLAKYINSAESLIYRKSEVIFGLFEGKDAISKENTVIVVEGQMDCISVSEAGTRNVVATCGTAFTEVHAKTLRRLASSVKFCFDSDPAGQKALQRAVRTCLSIGMETYVVSLSQGKDPDEAVRLSLPRWQKDLNSALVALQYYMNLGRHEAGSDNLKLRRFAAAEILPLLRLIGDPIEKEYWQNRLTEEYSISRNALTSTLSIEQEADRNVSQVIQDTRKGRQFEQQVLGGIIIHAEVLAIFREIGLSPESFKEDDLKVLAQNFFNNQPGTLESTLAKEVVFVVESLRVHLDMDSNGVIAFLIKNCYSLRLMELSVALAHVAEEMRAASGDKSSLEFLNITAADLVDQRVSLERRILDLQRG